MPPNAGPRRVLWMATSAFSPEAASLTKVNDWQLHSSSTLNSGMGTLSAGPQFSLQLHVIAKVPRGHCQCAAPTQTGHMSRMPFFALLLGTLAVSTAPPLILLADVPPFALAAWRLLAVALLLLPFAAVHLWRDLGKLNRRELFYLAASGVLYGVHFGLFNL